MPSFSVIEFLKDQHTKLEITPVDLAGKTIIVTGSNIGLGYETVRHFASMGATRIVLACRNMSKANDAIQKIKDTTSCDGVILEAEELDLSSLASCRDFAARYKERDLPLHILVNNAGIGMSNDYVLSKDNHEQIFATNHLGTTLLTLLLLPVIRKTASQSDSTYPRIIVLSSELHLTTDLPEKDTENIVKTMDDPKFFKDRYPVTKLMNLLFVRTLARHLAESQHPEDKKISVHAVNPGLVATNLGGSGNLPWHTKIAFSLMVKLLARNGVEGSKTTVHVSIAPECGIENGAKNGQYYSSCQLARVNPIVEGESGEKLGDRLWQETIELIETKPKEFDI